MQKQCFQWFEHTFITTSYGRHVQGLLSRKFAWDKKNRSLKIISACDAVFITKITGFSLPSFDDALTHSTKVVVTQQIYSSRLPFLPLSLLLLAMPSFFPARCLLLKRQGTITANEQETSINSENDPVAVVNGSFHFPAPTSSDPPMQRFASMDNLSNKAAGTGSLSAHSRPDCIMGGSFPDDYSPKKSEVKPPGAGLSMPRSSFMPGDAPNSMHSSTNGGSFSDDLHEVDL
ncbi:hypothetical protein HAX54_036367 [Datura stramonium]|uniref:Uncharacterized protein n=1 Tax=Datura stramonium TaxID=4076 RepID=A0ABS8VK24_DATST|nr:hypothetical protein [Datura stramonium]